MKSEKSKTEAELLAALKRGQVQLPPLVFADAISRPRKADSVSPQPQALVTVRWQEKQYRFAATCRRLWTRRVVSEAAEVSLRATSESGGEHPLVVVPYLSEEQLRDLEAKGVSGIDLCGNGVVVVPGELLVWRTGSPNQFRTSTAIKNVFRKDSSLVGRTFLVVPSFGSVGDVLEEIQRRGGSLSLGTVSKVCQSLDEDLIVAREPTDSRSRQMRLLQPERLLDRLADEFCLPEVVRRYTGRCRLEGEKLTDWLKRWETRTQGRIVRTGAGSLDAYAVMAREAVDPYYCSDLDALVRDLSGQVQETERFANVQFLQTTDQTVYFDRREHLTASPIQTYLESSSGEKRQRQTAEQVRRAILERLAMRKEE